MSFTFERLAWRLRTTRPSGLTTAARLRHRVEGRRLQRSFLPVRRAAESHRVGGGPLVAARPAAVQKCLAWFPGVDRTVTGYEGLIAAQQCLPDNATRDRFAADYSYLARLWEAISPDPSLSRPRNPPRTLLHHRGARRTDAGTRPRSRASRRLAKVDSKGFVPEAARAAERRNPCLTAKRSGYGVLAVRQGFEPWEEVNAPSTV